MPTQSITQSLWHRVFGHFSTEGHVATATGISNNFNYSSSPAKANSTDVEPIVRLWILRLLVPLECHRKLLTDRGYASDEIAQLLALDSYLTDDEQAQKDIQEDLRIALDLEPSDADKPLASKGHKAQKFDKHQARIKLLDLHAEAEHNAASILLPQPLAGNLQQLTRQVGLSPVEAQVLAFAVLIRTDRVLNNVSAWLDPGLNSLKIYHLLSVLLGFSVTEIREALATRSVLSQTALVVLQRRRGHQSDLDEKLEVLSRGFADRLVFEKGSPVDWLRDMVIPSQRPQLTLSDYPHIKGQLEFLLPYLQQALSSQSKGVNIFLYGTPGTGKTQLTRVLAQQLGCPLYEISSEDEEGDPVDGMRRLCAFRTAAEKHGNGALAK